MDDQALITALVPKQAIPYALAAVESLRSQDRLVRGLVSAELEPVTVSGQSAT